MAELCEWLSTMFDQLPVITLCVYRRYAGSLSAHSREAQVLQPMQMGQAGQQASDSERL